MKEGEGGREGDKERTQPVKSKTMKENSKTPINVGTRKRSCCSTSLCKIPTYVRKKYIKTLQYIWLVGPSLVKGAGPQIGGGTKDMRWGRKTYIAASNKEGKKRVEEAMMGCEGMEYKVL